MNNRIPLLVKMLVESSDNTGCTEDLTVVSKGNLDALAAEMELPNRGTLLDQNFIKKVEREHFRTDTDTGANECALMIWNIVRQHVGLARLNKSELPAYCETHKAYHIIEKEYGCVRKKVDND